MVTAGRLQGDAEAVNVERMSAKIVQVAPAGVITSLPNTNIADAVGRLPSVSLERDEGEGKYVQIRGTEPRLNNLTINGVNVPSVEVTVRNVKMDAIPANGIERIEVYKTLVGRSGCGWHWRHGEPGNADCAGETNLFAQWHRWLQPPPERLLAGRVRRHLRAAVGVRARNSASCWEEAGTGPTAASTILEPSQTFGTLPNGQNVAYINSEDMRSYEYYRTRYGFDPAWTTRSRPR